MQAVLPPSAAMNRVLLHSAHMVLDQHFCQLGMSAVQKAPTMQHIVENLPVNTDVGQCVIIRKGLRLDHEAVLKKVSEASSDPKKQPPALVELTRPFVPVEIEIQKHASLMHLNARGRRCMSHSKGFPVMLSRTFFASLAVLAALANN